MGKGADQVWFAQQIGKKPARTHFDGDGNENLAPAVAGPLPGPMNKRKERVMADVTVTMPLVLTPEMMRAVRDDPLCQVDGEQWHARLGWLICAWDVLVAQRLPAPAVDEALRLSVERTRDDLGPAGDNYPAVRKLLEFAEQAIAAGRA